MKLGGEKQSICVEKYCWLYTHTSTTIGKAFRKFCTRLQPEKRTLKRVYSKAFKLIKYSP